MFLDPKEPSVVIPLLVSSVGSWSQGPSGLGMSGYVVEGKHRQNVSYEGLQWTFPQIFTR